MEERETTSITREQLNSLRDSCDKQVEIANALNRLYDNSDFKLVFLDNYLKTEAYRLVGLLGDPTINMGDQRSAFREDIQERMVGIARFNEYIHNMFKMADQALNTLQSIEEAESENHTNYKELN